jgi:phosphoglucomutase
MTLQRGLRGSPIRFGTSGWRGILGEEFTFPRVRVALQAVATWILQQRRGSRVVVAYDTRFQSSRMAEIAEGVLGARGLAPLVTREAVPTPVAAHAVTRRRAAAGLVFTASHNPPEYHGLKVIGHRGGAIEAEDARRIERLALEALGDPAPQSPPRRPPLGSRVDFTAAYTRDLLALLDRDALRGAPPRVVYDAMHGVGARVLSRALRRSGVEVRLRRGRPDPRFGGGVPDPGPRRLRVLGREVRSLPGLRLGLATDGDADRFGVIDADGRMLSETEAVALLVDHLARTGRARRGVAVSMATGTLVERVAAAHGLHVVRRPIGFKHLSRALISGEADLAGDESGGFAFAPLGCDKDGILAGCLLAELVASTQAPLRRRLAELRRRFGRIACGRTAHRWSPRLCERLEKLVADPPGRVDGCAVRAVSAGDGLRLVLDDGFVMLRASGTEPVLRVYAEAPGPRELRRRMAAGAALLGPEPHG